MDLEVLLYGDPRLRRVSDPVAITPDLMPRIQFMFELMDREGGVGISAPQLGWNVRVICVDGDLATGILGAAQKSGIPLTKAKAHALAGGPVEGITRAFINPEIVEKSGEEEHTEGCLSMPGLFIRVKRHREVMVRSLELDGVQRVTGPYTGIYSWCIQHEIDHLDGKLLIDRVSTAKRAKAEKRLREAVRQVNLRRQEKWT